MSLKTGLQITAWFLCTCVIAIAMVIGTAMTAEPTGQFCIVSGGWQQMYSDQGITVYAQRTKKSKILAFRAEGILNAPIAQIMEVLRRVEIADEWMPDADGKYVLKEISDAEAITYSVNRVPFPFADRELVLLNKLRLDRERKFLVLDVYSVDYPSKPVKKGVIRAQMYCGEMRLRPAGKTERKWRSSCTWILKARFRDGSSTCSRNDCPTIFFVPWKKRPVPPTSNCDPFISRY